MGLQRKRAETIDATLTIRGQGFTEKFDVTYNNVTVDDYQAKMDDPAVTLGDIVLYVVRKWDTEFDLTPNGLREAESYYPGVSMAVIEGFHESRIFTKQKN